MSDFATIRARTLLLIERMVEQLEQKDGDFSNFDSQILEKSIKCTLLLELQANKSGKDSGYSSTSNEDLESEFE